MTFSEKYNKIKQLANKEILVIEDKLVENIQIREPLSSAITRLLLSPSKRIRPLVAILYSKACSEELSEEQLEILTIIELVHNASLIHDDIIDECKTRRGQKNISAQFDNKLGVISGDYLLAIVMEKLTKIGNLEIIQKLSQTIKQMCIGEINQNFNRFKIGTLEEYIEKTKNKTAYLFESALYCCMKLSNNQHNFQNICNFGQNIGIAFQIRDDILNFYQSDNTKPAQNDIKEGIYNAPVILGNKDDNYTSGIEKTKSLLNNYIKNALSDINTLPDNNYKKALEELLELLQNV